MRWVDTGFATIFTSLASNNLDMVAAAATITPERQQTVSFSNPYFLVNQSLTVNVAKTPAITSTDGLGSGMVVAAQSGTTGASWAKENLLPKGVQLKSFNLSTDMYTELAAGKVTGVINDEPASRAEVAGLPDLKAVNDALDRIIADGTYAKIFTKYFPGVGVPPQFQQ